MTLEQYRDQSLDKLLSCSSIDEVQNLVIQIQKTLADSEISKTDQVSFWENLRRAYKAALEIKVKAFAPKGVIRRPLLEGIFKEATSAAELISLMDKAEARLAQAKKESNV